MRLADEGRFTALWVVAVLVLGSLSVSAGVPTPWSPYSLVTIVPEFLVGSTPLNSESLPFRLLTLAIVAASPITLAFWLWVRPASARSERIPRRSIVLLLAVAALSVPYFIASWGYGMQYQGPVHTTLMLVFNTAFAVVGLLLWRSNRGAPLSTRVAAFHGILFCWLAWCAFPYLGELP